jgi:hypothetical protein
MPLQVVRALLEQGVENLARVIELVLLERQLRQPAPCREVLGRLGRVSRRIFLASSNLPAER